VEMDKANSEADKILSNVVFTPGWETRKTRRPETCSRKPREKGPAEGRASWGIIPRAGGSQKHFPGTVGWDHVARNALRPRHINALVADLFRSAFRQVWLLASLALNQSNGHRPFVEKL